MRASSKARSHIPPARSKGRASTAAITVGLTPCRCFCSTVMLPRPSCTHWAPSRGCFLVRLRSNMKNAHRVDFVHAPRGLSVIPCFCSPAAWLLLLRFLHPSRFCPSQLIFSPFPPSPPSLLPSSPTSTPLCPFLLVVSNFLQRTFRQSYIHYIAYCALFPTIFATNTALHTACVSRQHRVHRCAFACVA